MKGAPDAVSLLLPVALQIAQTPNLDHFSFSFAPPYICLFPSLLLLISFAKLTFDPPLMRSEGDGLALLPYVHSYSYVQVVISVDFYWLVTSKLLSLRKEARLR